jgi:hypothetical protein
MYEADRLGAKPPEAYDKYSFSQLIHCGHNP